MTFERRTRKSNNDLLSEIVNDGGADVADQVAVSVRVAILGAMNAVFHGNQRTNLTYHFDSADPRERQFVTTMSALLNAKGVYWDEIEDEIGNFIMNNHPESNMPHGTADWAVNNIMNHVEDALATITATPTPTSPTTYITNLTPADRTRFTGWNQDLIDEITRSSCLQSVPTSPLTTKPNRRLPT